MLQSFLHFVTHDMQSQGTLVASLLYHGIVSIVKISCGEMNRHFLIMEWSLILLTKHLAQFVTLFKLITVVCRSCK